MDLNYILNQHFLGNSIQQYLFSGAIFVLAFLFRKWGAKILSILLYRIFKRHTQESTVADFISHIQKPIQRFGLSVAFYLAIINLQFSEKVRLFESNSINLYVLSHNLAYIFLTFSVLRLLMRITDFIGHVMLVKAEKTESKTDDQLVPFFKDSVKVLLVIFSLLFILGVIFDLNVTAIIGGLGIGGLAVALAAQDSLANLLGSFTIFLDKPFQVGDIIEADGISGTVEKVGFRSTRIRTLDKSYVTIPNNW